MVVLPSEQSLVFKRVFPIFENVVVWCCMLLLWKLTLAIWTWDDTAACAEVSIVSINVLFVQTLTDMTTFANAMWQCVGWELCFPWPPHSGELGRWRWANIWNTLRLLLPSRITSCRSWHHPLPFRKQPFSCAKKQRRSEMPQPSWHILGTLLVGHVVRLAPSHDM